VGIVPPELRDKFDLTFDDVAAALRAEAGAALSFQSCTWFSPYRIHHRRAERFRSGRCFLLGDAAHIHSPVGAQGMNTGLQDAYNLAWKLALVVSARANETLLDSYAAERVPVAERLLSTTDRAFSLVVSDRWFAGFFRTRLMPKLLAAAMRSERIRKLAFRTISQIGIRYPHSPLSVTMSGLPEAAPVAGDRFPWLQLKFAEEAKVEDLFAKLDDTRFNLLVFGQPAPAGVPEIGDLLRIHVVPDAAENNRELGRAQIPRPSFFLLRPDGHVGFAGTALDRDGIKRYLRERLQLNIPVA
jgi:hypothetical protein